MRFLKPLYVLHMLTVFVVPMFTILVLAIPLVFLDQPVWANTLDVVMLVAITAITASTFGKARAFAMMKQHTDWMPQSIHVTRNDAGTMVAFVIQNNGNMLTIDLPDTISSQEEATQFILDQLQP